ncbi:hypothetical protein CBOM_01214 [Ceraceosorus bombacis]|uniref:Uncharacterized protein n=1 Tax=Ceraceosorus bombacis TaxID=401625 RepID=A0A0P1BC08_9BASI|nr:hypothetical protein CBOM_01214 [Ceraceosorus bombacis]
MAPERSDQSSQNGPRARRPKFAKWGLSAKLVTQFLFRIRKDQRSHTKFAKWALSAPTKVRKMDPERRNQSSQNRP